MYAIADFDLTNVIHRQDGSYVAIVKCSGIPYHIASDIDDYRHLLSSFSEYVSAHPECVTEEQPYVPPVPTLEQTKAAKLSEINKAADAAIATLTATYPDREISTFDKQESEARAYAVDSTASTPLLSALAQARGVPPDELVRRVLAKADAFAMASGSIIGQRQALEDRLDACTTMEEVQGITVNISMQGGGEA
ncbi:hypothetical protein HMPREF0178_02939 [Bilophila sp. 4_1_30]|uniref:hypothetical protein n=1 Tax=Bilophila sp. 4_1_30 TaxID=693988 RepID=UPI0002238025|nr:hypothetical protein [Bilophila sp. 4_1_30]EGW44244.1 hypothetical protein HMPREF0178_02939 [Bilophila sp. 4_1_30]